MLQFMKTYGGLCLAVCSTEGGTYCKKALRKAEEVVGLQKNPPAREAFVLLSLLLLGGWIFCKWLLKPLLPLLAAFLLACLLERPAGWLRRQIGLPQSVCALLALLIMLALLCGGGWLLLRFLAPPLRSMAALTPVLLENVLQSLEALQHRLFRGKAPFSASENAPFADIAPEQLLASVEWAASSLPDALLTAVFVPTAAVLLTGRVKRLLVRLQRQFPSRRWREGRLWFRFLRDALLGWLRAQALLSAAVFGLLLAVLLLLRIDNALLLSALIALADALPLLGAGLFLIPWGLAALLLDDTVQGVGVLLLFVVLCIVRNALEPRLVGRQLGLSPLVSLTAFYLGWRLAGIWGMLLGPLLVLVLVKLREWGYSKERR